MYKTGKSQARRGSAPSYPSRPSLGRGRRGQYQRRKEIEPESHWKASINREELECNPEWTPAYSEIKHTQWNGEKEGGDEEEGEPETQLRAEEQGPPPSPGGGGRRARSRGEGGAATPSRRGLRWSSSQEMSGA